MPIIQKQFAEYKEAEDILLNQDAAQVPLYQSASNYLINPKLKALVITCMGIISTCAMPI